MRTKIYVLVDDPCVLARFGLIGGQTSETGEALPLLDELKPLSVVAKKAQGTNAILQHLKSLGLQALIPSKNLLEQRILDEDFYALRNLIERFFSRIKQFRRVATRYDKFSERCALFLVITIAFIWLC